MQWLQSNNLVNFNDYPYTGVAGDCELSKVEGAASIKVTDSGPVYIGQTEAAMKTAVTEYGPISIVADASSW